jgi:hypothetical protein
VLDCFSEAGHDKVRAIASSLCYVTIMMMVAAHNLVMC